jgi:hypothetical protein
MSTKKTKVPKMYRQGDVLIIEVATIPEDAKEIPREGDLILQHGEVTGHAHRIPSRHAKIFRTEEDRRFMKVGGASTRREGFGQVEPVALNHEEHSTVVIPVGLYEVTIHAEYEPGELPRQVAD